MRRKWIVDLAQKSSMGTGRWRKADAVVSRDSRWYRISVGSESQHVPASRVSFFVLDNSFLSLLLPRVLLFAEASSGGKGVMALSKHSSNSSSVPQLSASNSKTSLSQPIIPVNTTSFSSINNSNIIRCGTGRCVKSVLIGGKNRRAISPPVYKFLPRAKGRLSAICNSIFESWRERPAQRWRIWTSGLDVRAVCSASGKSIHILISLLSV